MRSRGMSSPRKMALADFAALPNIIYAFKTTAKLAGWTITKSGDGTSDYSASGDVITTDAAGAGGMGQNLAWFVMRQPDAVEGFTPEYCIQLIDISVTQSTVRLKFSAADGFTGGSPDLNTVPSAADEQIILGGGSDASPTGVTLFSTLFNQTDSYGVGCFDNNSPYGFWLLGLGGNSGIKSAWGIWMHDPIEDAPHETDYCPYVIYAKGVVNVFSAGNINNAPGPVGWSGFNTANEAWRGLPMTTLNTAVASSNLVTVPGNMDANNYNGFTDLVTPVYGRGNTVTLAGIKGKSTLCTLIAQGDAEPREVVYSPVSFGESATYFRAGNAALYWDSTIPSGYVTASANLWNATAESSAEIYRMRALEASSGKFVFWDSGRLDTSGIDYAGTSSLSQITLFKRKA